MSLFQRPIQPPAILSDEAVERYLAAVRAELSVDPLFRRRLRGAVVNRFVAEREGRSGAPARSRRMGALGRAVLYATFALSVSVSSAMAASQGAAPGDALYALKLQIEHLRLQALPEHFHDDLAAHSLGERIHELDLLAERGDWARVAVQAEAVEDEYRHFLDTTRDEASSDRYLLVLTRLLQRLPDRAQLAIKDVLEGVEAASNGPAPRDGAAPREGAGQGGGSGSASDGRGGVAPSDGPRASAPAEAEPTPKPTRADRSDPTPRASKSPRPSVEPLVPSATDAADD
jgi:hypothetical protein